MCEFPPIVSYPAGKRMWVLGAGLKALSALPVLGLVTHSLSAKPPAVGAPAAQIGTLDPSIWAADSEFGAFPLGDLESCEVGLPQSTFGVARSLLAGQDPDIHEAAGLALALPTQQAQPALSLKSKPWSKWDMGLATAFWITFAADWLQTRQIAKAQYTPCGVRQYWVGSCLNTVPSQTGLVQEGNPLIGSRPSLQKVNTYFAAMGLGSAYLLHALPAKWRRAFLVAGLSLEAYVVRDNAKAGIRIRY